jgi:dihydropteroate synthase
VIVVYLLLHTKIAAFIKLQTLSPKITLNCKGRLISLENPVVMGILNVTPDSFYDGGQHRGLDAALLQAEKMLSDGATFIDIGGYSSRPGAEEIFVNEELKRTIPVIEQLSKRFPEAVFSIDTFRSKVAHEAIHAGAHIVNDISSGDDDMKMLSVVGALQVPYIMMHKKGTPQTMHKDPQYDNVVLEVINYFTQKVASAKAAGIVDLILDPGFGFGKNLYHNYSLLHALNDFQLFGLPILAGVSRKKMIQHVIKKNAEGALNGTTAANTVALLKGAAILRVHDVKEAIECINIVKATYGVF